LFYHKVIVSTIHDDDGYEGRRELPVIHFVMAKKGNENISKLPF